MKLSFLLALLCLVCSHANSQDKPSILLGSGGGITGMSTVYRVTQAGEVFKGQGIGEINYTECAPIKRAKAKELIAKVTTAVSSPEFEHPGNMYQFLSLKETDGEKKITWGDTNHPVPDNIKALYDEIQTAIADLTF